MRQTDYWLNTRDRALLSSVRVIVVVVSFDFISFIVLTIER
jgi:hypothetical protein